MPRGGHRRLINALSYQQDGKSTGKAFNSCRPCLAAFSQEWWFSTRSNKIMSKVEARDIGTAPTMKARLVYPHQFARHDRVIFGILRKSIRTALITTIFQLREEGVAWHDPGRACRAPEAVLKASLRVQRSSLLPKLTILRHHHEERRSVAHCGHASCRPCRN